MATLQTVKGTDSKIYNINGKQYTWNFYAFKDLINKKKKKDNISQNKQIEAIIGLLPEKYSMERDLYSTFLSYTSKKKSEIRQPKNEEYVCYRTAN